MNFTIKQITAMVTGAFKPIAAKMRELEANVLELSQYKRDIDITAKNALQSAEKNEQQVKNLEIAQKDNKAEINKRFTLLDSATNENQHLINNANNLALKNNTSLENAAKEISLKLNRDDFIKELSEFKSNQTKAAENYQTGVRYAPGETVIKNGGVYQAINETTATPGTTANWLLIQNGVKSATAKSNAITFEMTNGETIEIGDLKGEKGDSLNFKGLHTVGEQYQKNDICVTSGAAWIATKETTNTPPLQDWKLFVKRGPRGKTGEPGPGIDQNKLKNLIDDNFTNLIVKDVEPLIQKAFDQAVSGSMSWRGGWHFTKSYLTGDVVRADNALYVAIRPNSQKAPSSSPQDWSFILRNSNSGATGGGTGPTDVSAIEVSYDNTNTGIAATNVQDAIDDVFTLLYQYASLRTSTTTTQTFNDVTPVLLDIFDELTKESLLVSGDEIANEITANIDGYFEVVVAVNVIFPSNEELQLFANISGIDYPANPLSIQGNGNSKPVSLYWSTLLPLAAGDVVKIFGQNGDGGSFTCNFNRSRFSVEFKGPL